MVELIVKRMRGEATDIESRQLDRWRAAAPENEQEYQETVRLWNRAEETPAAGVSPPPNPSVAEEASPPRSPTGIADVGYTPPSPTRIVEEAEARRRRTGGRASGRAVLRSPWTAWGLATAAVLAALSIGLRSDGDPVSSVPSLTPLESSTGPGRMMTMSLSDGSVVRVAPETMMEFLPGTGRREVSLDGRVFFAVADDALPFVVRTAAGEVRVTGTRFEVSTDGDGLRLVVVEGTVELSNTHGTTLVRAGQVAFLTRGSTARVVDRADVWSLLDWAGGLLLFQGTPLAQVSEELGRHFGRTFRITDGGLRDRRITAWFEDETLEEVVSAVCIIAAARCEVGEDEVTIGG